MKSERARLRALLAADPLNSAARRSLLESARVTENPEQAGRWGLLLQGAATEDELDRFAHYVATRGAPSMNRLKRLLDLPLDMPNTVADPHGDLANFLRRVSSAQARKHVAQAEFAAQGRQARVDIEGLAIVGAVVVIAGLAVGGLALIVGLLIGLDSWWLESAARWILASIALVVAALLVVGIASHLHRRRK